MSRFSLPILAFLLAACLSEKNLEPAEEVTFTRYFSDGYVNDPVSVEETDDNGFIILANTNIKNSDADLDRDRIMLIKTDAFGQKEWISYFPDATIATDTRWKASSLSVLSSGDYLIAGEEIDDTGKQSIILLVVGSNGVFKRSNLSVGSPSMFPHNMIGRAAIQAPSKNIPGRNNFMILAYSPDDSVFAKNIMIAEVDTSTFVAEWVRRYAGTDIILTNRLIYKPGSTPYLYWGGELRVSATETKAFVTQCLLDAGITQNGQDALNLPVSVAHLGDFTPKGDGFGLIGSTNQGTLLDDIFFGLASPLGAGSNFKQFVNEIFDIPENFDRADNVKAERGASIASTTDGGFIMLATIDTYTGTLGRGNTDLLMLKVNGLGGKLWSRPYGNPDIDGGVCVRQTSDGGYIVLGHTRVAALRSILLIKTDKEGLVN